MLLLYVVVVVVVRWEWNGSGILARQDVSGWAREGCVCLLVLSDRARTRDPGEPSDCFGVSFSDRISRKEAFGGEINDVRVR